MLVDSETVVKNDQLIRDEVLTFSRGYVEKYEVVKQYGRRTAWTMRTIQATVARDKLAETLRGMKIAVADTRGEPASRQFEFDAKNEEQAAEIFQKARGGSNITDLRTWKSWANPRSRGTIIMQACMSWSRSAPRMLWEQAPPGASNRY